ncbi:Mitochondrial tRNAs modification protein [Extremus antarcticus]|uniref:Mitochondrial tRNAs modification protein n=1 Tax=Extremus antarcticus TaxID=702011 RepID=A0AAJ0D4F0_9PEZI|nr:Mitochondrial tRNAs modification protein [Extremus antarcticus]
MSNVIRLQYLFSELGTLYFQQLPPELLIPLYRRAMENFAFRDGEDSYDYTPPRRRHEELEARLTRWGRFVRSLLAENAYVKTNRRTVFSFTGMLTCVGRLMTDGTDSSID